MAYPQARSFIHTLPSGQRQRFVHYIFSGVGDEIPLHEHPNSMHSTMVLKGPVEVYDGTGKSKLVETGQFVEFAAGRQHAIRAKVAFAEVMNAHEPTQ